ncbi:hypothetical protein [Sulfurimonas sp.]
MKKLLLQLLFILPLTLFAQNTSSLKNPKVYSALGDVIFDNAQKIKNLKQIDKYASYKTKIDEYILNISETKKLGLVVESGKKDELKSQYLEKLRKLSKINDYFFRSTENAFKSSLQTQNHKLFIEILNSNMIDSQKYKSEIMDYYNKYSKEIKPNKIIQDFIDENNAKKNKKRYKGKTKEELLEEKMRRIRQHDKERQEALERRLSKEVELKKEKIRQEQERELFE